MGRLKVYNPNTAQWEYAAPLGTGPTGPPGVVAQTTAPADTDVLWYDTDDDGGSVIEIGSNADTVDGFHAASTPTANTIPVLDSNGLMPTASLGGVWASWTPSLTNITVGNGTGIYLFTQIGKTVHYRILFTLGSTSAFSNSPTFSLPVTANTTGYNTSDSFIGNGSYRDNGGSLYPAWLVLTSSTTGALRSLNTSAIYASTTGTTPFTWGTGDSVSISGTYEAA